MDVNALLCDHAQVSGKLFISGANINRFAFAAGAPAPYAVTFSVAGVVEVPWNATNADHRLSFLVLDEDGHTPELAGGTEAGPGGIGGEMVFNVGRPAGVGAEEQLVPFAFNFVQMPLARPGRYHVGLSLDGNEVRRLHFSVWVEPSVVMRGPAAPGPNA